MRARVLALAGATTIGALALSATPAFAQDDLLQGVGLVPGMSCATFTDPTLDWAGVPSTGWSQSWAEWVNEGRGGDVCVRTLHYDGSTWTVR